MSTVYRFQDRLIENRNGKLRQVRYSFDLVSNLIARDMKFRYKGSILGMAWSLLQPACLIAIYSFLFTRVLPLGIQNYVPFLVVGILPWNWFASSLDFSADALIGNRDLIKKAVFPNEILLIATISSNLLILGLATPVLLVFLLISSISLTPVVLMLPVIVAIQYTFTLGVAFLISTLNVFFRDTRHLLGVILFGWFFLTPVFYDAANVPAKYLDLYMANPMAHIIGYYRDILIYARMPSLFPMLQLALVCAAVLAFGLVVFRRYKSCFPEEL